MWSRCPFPLPHHRRTRLLRATIGAAGARAAAALAPAAVLASAAALGGCVANSSNPHVVIRSATMSTDGAEFDLEIENPGGRNLTVTRLAYEVSHGESAFPVASGTWTGDLSLPAGGRVELPLLVRFASPTMEPDSRLLHLAGELGFVDRTGFLGIGAMDLTSTPFRGQVQAREAAP